MLKLARSYELSTSFSSTELTKMHRKACEIHTHNARPVPWGSLAYGELVCKGTWAQIPFWPNVVWMQNDLLTTEVPFWELEVLYMLLEVVRFQSTVSLVWISLEIFHSFARLLLCKVQFFAY